MVCQLGECLCRCDSYTDRNACTAQHLGPDLAAELLKAIDSREICEGFINLKERCQPMDIGLNEYL